MTTTTAMGWIEHMARNATDADLTAELTAQLHALADDYAAHVRARIAAEDREPRDAHHLAYLRWRWTLDASNPARMTTDDYADLVDGDPDTIAIYATAHAERQRPEPTPSLRPSNRGATAPG